MFASVFWDSCGVNFIDYLDEEKAKTGEYYSVLL